MSDSYLIRHQVMEYLNDSVQQLLESRHSNTKTNVVEFFTEYFRNVLQGNHVLFREYNFISVTPHNRASFILKFYETYTQMLSREDDISLSEFFSLVQLICPDFQFDIVLNSFKTLNNGHEPALFKDFFYTFQLQFYYKEFCADFIEFFDKLSAETPSLDKDRTTRAYLDHYETRVGKINLPSKSTIRDILLAYEFNEIKSFNCFQFLNRLAFSDKLVAHIGRLPLKKSLDEQIALIKQSMTRNMNLNAANNPAVPAPKEEEEVKVKKQEVETETKPANLVREKNLLNLDNSNNQDNSSSDSSSDTDT